MLHLQRERVLAGRSLLPTTYMPTLRCALVSTVAQNQQCQGIPACVPTFLLPAVTPGHYLFAWRGAGAAAAAADAALVRPATWPYVLPGQLAPGDVMPVAAADWSGDRRLVLARVTAVERQEGEGVYMPHTLTGVPRSRAVQVVVANGSASHATCPRNPAAASRCRQATPAQ